MSKVRGGSGISRRDFTWMLGAGGGAFLGARLVADQRPAPLPPAPASPDEAYWAQVRAQFLVPRDVTVLCAANLTPTSVPVLDVLEATTHNVDRDPSLDNRRQWTAGREETRRVLAEFIHAVPEDVVITRNTSEGNNLVTSGLDLKPGDEVVTFGDNHPSINTALREKSKRFGFTVKTVDLISPYPGAERYVEAFAAAVSPRTTLLAVTHVTASVGDLMPVGAICRMARERGVLSLVDGAQSFGILEIDVAAMGADFFTGSAHKWPCGPKEFGVLYMRREAQDRVWPSLISLYAGAVGASQRFEAFGQRDEAGFIAFGEALRLQNRIGRARIESRSRELAGRLRDGLTQIDGVTVLTPDAPSDSAAIVTFRPGALDAAKLAAALYERDHIITNARGSGDRGSIRLSPHFYVIGEEIDRTLAAVKRHMAAGTGGLGD